MVLGVSVTIRYITNFEVDPKFEYKIVGLQLVLLTLSSALFISGGFDDVNLYIFTLLALGIEIILFPYTLTYVLIGLIGRCKIGKWLKRLLVIQVLLVALEIIKIANTR
jgi:hypothetical protein